MGSAAAIIVVVGIIALIYSVMERVKAQRVTKTPFFKTGQVGAQPGGSAVSAEGNVICPQPLLAPMSGTPCLYYAIKSTAEWKEGETVKRRELANHKFAARFWIDDGTGGIGVDASQGGTFEPTQNRSDTKSSGLLGGITGKDLLFGQYAVSTGALSLGTKYKVEEEVFALQPRLYVCGSAGNGAIATPSGLRSLLISNKTRDHLLSSALKTSKFSMIGGGAAVFVGTVLGVISRLIAASPTPAVASAPSELNTTVQAALAAPTTTAAAPTALPTTSALPVAPIEATTKGAAAPAPAAHPAAAKAATAASAVTPAAKPAVGAAPAVTAKTSTSPVVAKAIAAPAAKLVLATKPPAPAAAKPAVAPAKPQ